jgi:hypothetical protein
LGSVLSPSAKVLQVCFAIVAQFSSNTDHLRQQACSSAPPAVLTIRSATSPLRITCTLRGRHSTSNFVPSPALCRSDRKKCNVPCVRRS